MYKDKLLENEIRQEKNKSNHERYLGFEWALRFMLHELNIPADMHDLLLVDDIKQCVIVYSMKDTFAEQNNVFLSNLKEDFYRGISNLEKKHADIKRKTMIVKIFMEDFYFKQ